MFEWSKVSFRTKSFRFRSTNGFVVSFLRTDIIVLSILYKKVLGEYLNQTLLFTNLLSGSNFMTVISIDFHLTDFHLTDFLYYKIARTVTFYYLFCRLFFNHNKNKLFPVQDLKTFMLFHLYTFHFSHK